MGGKTSQSTQSTSVPPQVLANYQSAYNNASTTANNQFQTYGAQGTQVAPDYAGVQTGNFVAPINAEQELGIGGTSQYANAAQPYYGAAAGTLGNAQAGTTPYNLGSAGILGMSQAGTTGINQQAAGQTIGSSSPLTGQQINQYLSPYLNTVLGSESALLNQNNQQQQAGQLGTAISSGAFGGDRTGIAAANLEQQQNLANANIYGGILNTGYQSALGTAQGQQQIGLQGAQQLAGIGQTQYGEGANTAAQLAALGQTQYGEGANTASEYGALGTGAQTAGLAGASAELGAGTVEQQTQQAQDTAQYNQFLQQQSYPFQVDQFLANIAEGTGALSGSTTQTTQPGGFFSDERLKDDARVVGKLFDGQKIYSYKLKGDPRTRIGLMAQQVEKRHPQAVGLAAGYRMVDYGKATEKAANRGHFAPGGAVDIDAILAQQGQMYAPFSGAGLYGGSATGTPRGGSSRVPSASMPIQQLQTPQGGLRQQQTGAQNVADLGKSLKIYSDLYNQDIKPHLGNSPTATATPTSTVQGQPLPSDSGISLPTSSTDPSPNWPGYQMPVDSSTGDAPAQARGGVVGYDTGGMPYQNSGGDPTELDIPDENAHNQPLRPATLPQQAPSGFQQLTGMLGNLGQGVGGFSQAFGGGGGGGGAGADAGGGSDALLSEDLTDELRRGGRISRDDGGFVDADSAPNSQNLGDAPDTTVLQGPQAREGGANTSLNSVFDLAAAAAEAYLGDYGGAAGSLYKAYNATQTNNRRGGRIHKDAGGGTTDPDADAVDLSQASSGPQPIDRSGGTSLDERRVPGSVIPMVVPAMSRPTEESDGPSLWDRFNNFMSKPRIPTVGEQLAAANYSPADNHAPQTTSMLGSLGDSLMAQNEFGPPQGVAGNSGSTTPTVMPASGPSRPYHRNVAPTPANLGTPAAVQGAPLPADNGIALPDGSQGPQVWNGYQMPGGNNPPPATSSINSTSGLTASPPDKQGGGLWDSIKGVGSGLAHLFEDDDGHVTSSKVIPWLTAIGAMGTTPTRHLGVALASGLNAGAQAYQPAQATAANIARTQQGTYNLSQYPAPDGTVTAPGVGANGQSVPGPHGPQHFVPKVNAVDFSNQPAPKAPAASPITVDANGVHVAPSAQAYQPLAQYGVSPTASPWANHMQMTMKNPSTVAQEKAEEQIVNEKYLSKVPDAEVTQRALLQLSGAVNQVPDTGPGAPGAGYEYRNNMLNIYNTARRVVGLPEDPEITKETTAQQIANKVSTLWGPQQAAATGQRGEAIAQALIGIAPGGKFNKESANDILSTLLANNQQTRDFNTYYQDYKAHTGTALGVQAAFNHDMMPIYAQEQQQLPWVMRRHGNESPVESIRRDPTQVDKFEQKFGTGTRRYFQ